MAERHSDDGFSSLVLLTVISEHQRIILVPNGSDPPISHSLCVDPCHPLIFSSLVWLFSSSSIGCFSSSIGCMPGHSYSGCISHHCCSKKRFPIICSDLVAPTGALYSSIDCSNTIDHGPSTMDHGPWTINHGP